MVLHGGYIEPLVLAKLPVRCYDGGMKYVPSALIGQLSRSSGSTTASRNRYGSYLRNRVQPADPSTAKQAAKRAQLTQFSQDYGALTDSQRAGWKALGEQITRTDTLGQTYNLTGLQAFVLVNANLATVGGTALDDAPAYSPPPPVTALTITLSSA